VSQPKSRPSRSRSARLIGIGAALALVATAGTIGVTSAQAAPARTATAKVARASYPTPAVKPTIVLVHGAFADAAGWDSEIDQLTRLGYPVIAPANPLRGLSTDAAYIRSVLDTITGPIILVGHSYGGSVISEAAEGDPNVKAMVYAGAFLPYTNESTASVLKNTTLYPGSLLSTATLTARPFPNAAVAGGEDADLYITPSDFREVFAGDESVTKANELALTQRPLAASAYNEALTGVPAWSTIPTWDLITLNDKAISPAGQMMMAKRAHAHISTVWSSHDVMISHPTAVVAEILSAVKAEG